MTELKKIDGDVGVGRHAVVGGDATVRGSLEAGHNVIVRGWLDAPHQKGVCRGLYESSATLESDQPQPHNGWWALVGASFPLALYRAYGGKWYAAEGTIDKINVVGVDLYDKEIPALREQAALHEERLAAAEAADTRHDSAIEALQVTGAEHAARLAETEANCAKNALQIGNLDTKYESAHRKMVVLEMWRESLEQNADYINELSAPRYTARLVVIGFKKGSLADGGVEDGGIAIEGASAAQAGVMTAAQVRLLETLSEHFDEAGMVTTMRLELDSLNEGWMSLSNQTDELKEKLLDTLPANADLVKAGYQNNDENETAEEEFLRTLYRDLLKLYGGGKLLSTDVGKALEMAANCPVKRFDAIVPTFEELRANHTLYEGLICYVSDRNCFIRLVDRFFPDYLTPEYNRKKGDDEWTPRADCVFLLGGRLYVWFNNALQYFVTNEEFEGLRVILEQAKGDTSVLRQAISALENAIGNQEERLTGTEVYGTQTRILLTQINERLSERIRLLSSESQELSKEVLGLRKDIGEAFDDINQCLGDILSEAKLSDYNDDNVLSLTTDTGEPLLTESEAVTLI